MQNLDQIVTNLQEAAENSKVLSEQMAAMITTARENGDVKGLLDALEEHFRTLSIQEALEGEYLAEMVQAVHSETRGDLEHLLSQVQAIADQKFRGYEAVSASLRGTQGRFVL